MSNQEGPATASEIFLYDHLGNRYQETVKNGFVYTYSHNPVNQYSKRQGTVMGFEFDEFYSHDDNGNLEIDEQWNAYTYDYRNRLTKVEDYESNVIAEYVYDALGRRISKTVGNTTTHFIYDPQGRVIAEYEQDTQAKEFVYGNGFNEVVAMFLPQNEGNPADWDAFIEFVESWLCIDPNDACYNAAYDHNSDDIVNYADFAYFAGIWDMPSNNETRFYYLHDALGSVRGLIGGRFNRESDREFYNYDVYGKSTDVSAVGNPFRFAGYRLDVETGLYHTPFRTYDPETGRWLQIDPIGYADGWNLYEYVQNNPVNYADPFGLAKNLSRKIAELIALRAGRGFSVPLNIYNRFRQNYDLQDELNEMSSSIGEDLFRFYADAVNLNKSTLYASVGKWTVIQLPPPKPVKREWRTGLVGTFPGLNFWLHEAHDIRANGKFEAKVDCNNTILIRKIDVKYEWYDQIDANSYRELKNSGNWKSNDFALWEAGWDILGDKLLGSSFYVTIKWIHQVDDETDISNYVRQRGVAQ